MIFSYKLDLNNIFNMNKEEILIKIANLKYAY